MGVRMKWYLVALLTGQLTTTSPHAGGHAMQAWEIGEGDAARLVCLVHVQTFVQHHLKIGVPQAAQAPQAPSTTPAPSTSSAGSAVPGAMATPLPVRIQEMVDIDIVKTIVCLDESSVRSIADNKLGRDTLEVRPSEELAKKLPPTPAPPAPLPNVSNMPIHGAASDAAGAGIKLPF